MTNAIYGGLDYAQRMAVTKVRDDRYAEEWEPRYPNVTDIMGGVYARDIAIIDGLISQGYLVNVARGFYALDLTDKGREYLAHWEL